MELSKLPFRKNCEGYFIDKKGNLLAKDSGKGYLIFPGGGVEQNESIEDAMKRETLEETGAKVTNLNKCGELKIIWEKDWAITEKQRQRYQKYQGDEMHFFKGMITSFNKIIQQEDSWEGKKLIPLKEVISFLEQQNSPQKEYREMQLKLLKEL